MSEHDDPAIRIEDRDPRFRLRTNPVMDDIVSGFAQTQPDWEAIANRLRMIEDSGGQQVKSLAAEFHLITYLEAWSRYTSMVKVNPIPNDGRTGRFRFSASRTGSYEVEQRTGKGMFAEYDALISVSGLPVLFEAKIRRNHLEGKNGINSALSPDTIARKLTPIQDYFERLDIGYIVVLPSNQVNEISPVLQDFRRMGGIIAPFPGTYNWFDRHFTRARKQYKF